MNGIQENQNDQPFVQNVSPLIGTKKRKPISEQTREKMRLARLGKPSGMLGKHQSEETKRKIGEANAKRLLGKRLSEEHKQKIGEASKRNGNKPPVHRGEQCWNWKGGITPENTKIRKSPQYKEWQQAVFRRDNFTCVLCGARGSRKVEIHADHIKPFAYYKDLRFELSNGRTLCRECHLKTDTYGFKEKKNVTLV